MKYLCKTIHNELDFHQLKSQIRALWIENILPIQLGLFEIQCSSQVCNWYAVIKINFKWVDY